MHYLSICIPTYEMKGVGVKYLKESFEILEKQTFKDFEIVISDHSKNNDIENLCIEYKDIFTIKYVKNENSRGNSSANLNNAIKNATGKLIKILFQDDFLFNEKSLEETVENFDIERDRWLVSACEHSMDGKNFQRPFYPKYNHKIHLGKNTISSPSVLTIKNEKPLLFDESLIWLMDCDYYRKLYDTFGDPKILNKITVVNRIGKHQVTKTLATRKVRKIEKNHAIKKFGKNAGPLQLPMVTLVAVSSVNIEETIQALRKSMRGINFAKTILITHEKINLDNDGIQVIYVNKLNYDQYSEFIAYKLVNYVDTEFALIVQHDGYVKHPKRWDSEFLNYDYIGAPWRPNTYFTEEKKEVRVGNGGFSLRSKKLMGILHQLNLPFTDNKTGFYHEDGILCAYYRKKLENAGIKFAPVSVASKFSREKWCTDSRLFPFGFHNNRHNLKKYLRKKIIKFFSKIKI